jgi:O-antigen/teichoic acid export membrane protein
MNSAIAEKPLPKPASNQSRALFNRAILLLPKLLEFGVIQTAVQFISALSGFIVIRILTKQDYAWFTIANSMLATMNLLADTGITSSLSSIGGPLCQDRTHFGQLINTALGVRRKLALVSATTCLPVLVTLLLRNKASARELLIMPVLVAGAFWLQISVGILYVVPRLTLRTRRLQTLDFTGGALRLALIGVAAITWLNSITVFSASLGALCLQFWLLKKWVPEEANLAATASVELARKIKGFVRRQAPNTLFYAVQSQISVWLISILGSTKNVAEVGALSRLGLLLAIVTAFLNSLIVPRLARMRDSHSIAFAYWMALAAVAALGTVVIAAVAWFPGVPLWVLGAQYSNLRSEILLAVTGSVLNCITGVAWELNASRGWIVPIHLNVAVTIAIQIVLVFVLNLSTIHGVLLMNAILSLSTILVCCTFGNIQIGKLAKGTAVN